MRQLGVELEFGLSFGTLRLTVDQLKSEFPSLLFVS